MEQLFEDGISIVTIVLNGEHLIEETILSVIQQKDVSFEYIIIDGGSSDGTLDKIAKYKQYISHCISGPDGGIFQAINKGISLAKYQLIGLIHCGDFYTADALPIVYQYFKKSNADVLYGDIIIRENLGNKVLDRTFIADHTLLKKRMSIFHPSTFIKLSVYQEIGLYDTTFRSASDYEYLLNLYLKKYTFIHIPHFLAVFRSGGTSGTDYQTFLLDNYKIRKKHLSVFEALQYLIHNSTLLFYLEIRKKIVSLLIGKENYNRLKFSFHMINRKTDKTYGRFS